MNNNLHVEVVGSGPDMVLLHGWGLNSACWQSIVPLLSQSFRLHLIDLPGFGLSHDHFVQSGSLDDISAALFEVVPEQAIWLGWSLGGLCATHFSLKYPDSVAALVTVASSPKFLATPSWNGIADKVLETFKLQLQQDLAKTVARFLAIQAMGSDSAKQDIKALKQYLVLRPQPHAEALSNGLTLLSSVDLRTDLARLSVPVYRLYGRLDSLVPRSAIGHINGLLPDSPHVIFQHSSHAPFISEPELFVKEIENFFNKLP